MFLSQVAFMQHVTRCMCNRIESHKQALEVESLSGGLDYKETAACLPLSLLLVWNDTSPYENQEPVHKSGRKSPPSATQYYLYYQGATRVYCADADASHDISTTTQTIVSYTAPNSINHPRD